MSNIAIQVKHLTKIYKLYDKPIDRLKESLHPLKKQYHKDFYALNDVSFEIKKGETVGIIGKNGAGKSTLLKIITGVLTPTSGSIHVNGRIASLLELGAGFNPEYTGVENIYFQGSLMGYTRAEMESKIDDILAFADIGDFVHQSVKMYSSGMFARLAFAVAINVDPDVLIVDEALSVGDAAFQKKCLDRINQMKSKNISILLVSHDDYTVKFFCERALYLSNGQQKYFGNSSEAIDLYTFDTREKMRKVIESQVINTDELNGKDFFVKILDVYMRNTSNEKTSIIATGDSVSIEFKYEIVGNYEGKLTFVINLYRHDDFYICGATSLMDKELPYIPGKNGLVRVELNNLPILSGMYKWRVAINDESGMGIFAEAVPVCEMKVIDHLESVGAIHINRKWSVNYGTD
jgi:ABC-type polysaccharide/polyol phosphate transport system ATPase subunit